MNDLSDKVVISKCALMSALGDNSTKYLANMKLWFRHKWTKEQFDYECRKFLTQEKMHLHNQFLIAILNKIDAFQVPQDPSPTIGGGFSNMGTSGAAAATNNNNGNRKAKRKKSSRVSSDRVTFEPYDFLDFVMEDSMKLIRPATGTEANVQILPTQRYCVQELFLPDTGFILGRFLIGAWECGLVNVEDNVAEYVAMAVQALLKNLISAVIMKKDHYKITGEGSFYYDIGTSIKDPSVRNTVTRQKLDDAPLDLDKEITSPNFMRRSNDDVTFLSACEEVYPKTAKGITLKDCQNVFSDRNLIPSHSVYAINMERLTQMMH